MRTKTRVVAYEFDSAIVCLHCLEAILGLTEDDVTPIFEDEVSLQQACAICEETLDIEEDELYNC